MTPVPATPPPDTRDWLVVLEQGCDECGWSPHPAAESVQRLRAAAPAWTAVLARDDARHRPAETTWSPLEYACHLRDVVTVWEERTRAMVAEDDPVFSNFDGDATAIARQYWNASPAAVADEFAVATAETAGVLEGLSAEGWERPGRRGDGAPFTVSSLALYFSHELTHHLRDANGCPTVAS